MSTSALGVQKGFNTRLAGGGSKTKCGESVLDLAGCLACFRYAGEVLFWPALKDKASLQETEIFALLFFVCVGSVVLYVHFTFSLPVFHEVS